MKKLSLVVLQTLLLTSTAFATDAGGNKYTKATLPIKSTGITGNFKNLNDADWYKLNIVKGNHYSITFNTQIPGKYELDLIQPSITKYDTYGYGGVDTAGLEFTAKETGVRYVAVHAIRTNNKNSFPIKYKLTARKECANDTTTKCALPLNTNQAGRFDWAQDQDYWKISVVEGKSYNVDLSASPHSVDIYAQPITNEGIIQFPGGYGGLTFVAKYTGDYYISLYTSVQPDKYNLIVKTE